LCQKILIIIKNDKARQANGILKVSKRQDNLEAVFKISQTRFKRVKVKHNHYIVVRRRQSKSERERGREGERRVGWTAL